MLSDSSALPQGFFRKNAWKKFNAKACLRVLADESEAYNGLKKVLYAGICAWMIAPQDPKLIKGALALATLKTLSEAEEEALAGNWATTTAADIVARSIILGPGFIEEIYYPVGGALGLARAPAIKDFKSGIQSAFPHVEYAITIVKIYHHHVAHLLGQRRYGKPSLNKTADLVAELGIMHGDHETPTRSRYLKGAWARNRETIAFLYAASTIETKNGRTLLDKIRLCENNYEDDQSIIPVLLGRAKFISAEILSNCVDIEPSEETDWLLPRKTTSESVPNPVFGDNHYEIIRRKFSRSAV